MATDKDKDYIKPVRMENNPADEERDADETSEGGTAGIDMQETSDLAEAQTAGSRNVRSTGYDGVKHNTEPYGSTQTAGAEQKDDGHAAGITSKKLSEELGADSYVKPHHSKGNEGAFGDEEEKSSETKLPSGLAEKVETVQPSTGTLNK